MTLLALRDVSTGYKGSSVLEKISLDIHRGDKVALIGPSGAGKSTLLKVIYKRLVSNDITWIPQSLGLVPDLSIFHNIYMGRLNRNSVFKNVRNFVAPAAEPLSDINAIVDRLGIDESPYKQASALSGGQRQRVAIGRALYQGGSVLLADEPFSALDGARALQLMAVISSEWETSVVALHDIGLARSFAGRVIGIRGGEIVLDRRAVDLTASEIALLYK